jgi:hypothetical protein
MTMARRKRLDTTMTIAECAGCTMIDGGVATKGICTAFSDPKYQWRNGECWGRCDTAEEMIRRLQAIITYNEGHGMNTAGVAKIRLELEDWRETVRVLRGEIA